MAARRALDRIFRRSRREEKAPAPDRALSLRAASAISEYVRTHATLFERAERLREKAERLEKAGTPSESARNRADRAESELEAGLLALRAAFAASAEGRAGEIAFDREVERRIPPLGFSGPDL